MLILFISGALFWLCYFHACKPDQTLPFCVVATMQVSYNAGLRHFTVHSYPIIRKSCFFKPRRDRKDFRFVATNSEEAFQWVSGFADQQCFINCLPHPMVSSKKQPVDVVTDDPLFDQPHVKSKSPPKILVILNPRSGHGRSSKVFHGKVEPIFEVCQRFAF